MDANKVEVPDPPPPTCCGACYRCGGATRPDTLCAACSRAITKEAGTDAPQA